MIHDEVEEELEHLRTENRNLSNRVKVLEQQLVDQSEVLQDRDKHCCLKAQKYYEKRMNLDHTAGIVRTLEN